MRPPELDGTPFRTVVIGGGTGLPVVLRGLKPFVGREVEQLTGIVTVTDDGGSSGRLRRDFGVLPPGDIRNCIVALADDEAVLSRLFQYRFPTGEGLSGHSFGNLLLTALTGITGDFYQAILTAESILSVRGKVLPATLSDGRLKARGASGKVYLGESAVGNAGEPLAEVALDPPSPAAFGPAVKALEDADLILLGPGSLYTSILPNLLIPGILAAVRRSGAPVVLVLNLMTQPGETDAMSALDHLEALERHAGEALVHQVLVHGGPWPRACLEAYALTGSMPLALKPELLEARGVRVVERDLLADCELLRHDPGKLGRAVLDLGAETLRTRRPALKEIRGGRALP
ncbi:MAG: uridine diphosphate-N-acetylglucosamine-binding protein YvcK [Acidobacteria bacterium]|nr:uridine diphosphate-N-acetylglucosamine-binding protein YvcK [Acidobacteriota bacterium]